MCESLRSSIGSFMCDVRTAAAQARCPSAMCTCTAWFATRMAGKCPNPWAMSSTPCRLLRASP